MKLTEEEILKGFGDYHPPRWMIDVVKAIASKHAIDLAMDFARSLHEDDYYDKEETVEECFKTYISE